MKLISIISLLFALVYSDAFASCEATIIEGKHTASSKDEAVAAAWEDAKELCYPGKAIKETLECKTVPSKNEESEKLFRCSQKIVCNLCGEALMRKLEAQEDSDEPVNH
ncbi:hypothetical protein [Pleionea sediminis]|uniref:hypothetical protein n=1 Tax=Pleionea sediminis TaxID=2569479 RepID=UPI00118707FD|nr:hypothetical protein [Pleionea sediminis]